ncbi:MAG: alpha/beta hydrolase [Bacteroidota bacterium]
MYLSNWLSTEAFKKHAILFIFLLVQLALVNGQSAKSIKTEELSFKSKGVSLVGTLHKPQDAHAAIVIVHGSGQEPRMNEFASLLAQSGIIVLTYDKRGVGASGGVYVGPEVGTNNIDSTNLNLLAKDASAAVKLLHQQNEDLPIGLLGFSQAGWIIPIATKLNPEVDFMVLFSCPLINTLEQLRFQFYTNGRTDFWENHTEAEAREHIQNDPDRYQFIATDPMLSLHQLATPGLWIFGGKDIQIPASLCIEKLNILKAEGKPFEYTLFANLGHNTAFAEDSMPVEIAVQWIRSKSLTLKE